MATTVTALVSAHSEMFTDSPLTKMLMSSEKCAEQSEDFSWKEKLYRFILIAGSRYALVTLSILIHALIFLLGLMHSADDIDGFKTLKTTSVALMVADASTLVLHFDLAVILLPVSYHKLVAWSMVFFTWVHAIAHWINYIQLASKNDQGPKGFFLTCLTTGSGWSGHIMLFSLMIVAVTSTERIRVLKWQRFWSTHHLFILFFVFWSIHGAFSTTRAGKPMTWTRTATFWQYWLIGGMFYLVEKALREVRGRHKTHISKVVQHPSNVVEVQIKKRQTTVKTGQHIYLCCPEISVWQWRAFVLTSAPEEDYLAVHIHCYDQFTRSLATSVGCSFEYPKDGSSVETSLVVGCQSTNFSRVAELHEPFVLVTITLPEDYLGKVIELCEGNRGEQKELSFFTATQVILKYELPLAHLVDDFFGKLKGVTKGYASLDYEESAWRKSCIVKLQLLVNGKPVDAVSRVVHTSQTDRLGRQWVTKFKDHVDRQMFEVIIQAAAGRRIVARETIKPFRKDVLAKLHAADVSRRRKLLENQKEGRKKLRAVGNIAIDSSAFQAFLAK